MKKIFYILFILLATNSTVAQVNTNLVVSATPPSSLLQWSTNREILTYIISPAQGLQAPYKIKTEIKLSDGTVVGKTDLAKATTYNLASTTTIYNASDVIPMQYMVFTGKYKTSLEKTGKLPADNYQICVQLVRPPDFVPFSEEKCRSFNLAATQLPILLKPYNEEVLNYDLAKTAIIFRWSPVVPTPKFIATYKLMVFEVLPHQNPVQAMRSNFPILTQEVRGTTQYIWQPQGIIENEMEDQTQQRKGWNGTVKGSSIESVDSVSQQRKGWNGKINEDETEIRKGWNGTVKGKKYVWTIQSFDNLGQPLGDGNVNADGVSEPVMFIITKGGKEVDKLKEEIKK
ncbi:MAG: hypothetical protein KA319_02875 [Ferruginibacter sp.]|nr:hypothetical protein [Ferruginibacter sp.]